MLHAALFLFLAGLSLLIWGLDRAVARTLLSLTAALVAFYSNALPLLPLSINYCRPGLFSDSVQLAMPGISALRTGVAQLQVKLTSFASRDGLSWYLWLLENIYQREPRINQERRTIQSLIAELDAVSIDWIVRNCPAPDVVTVACQAVGALSPVSPTAGIIRKGEIVLDRTDRYLRESFGHAVPRSRAEVGVRAPDFARTLRSLFCLTDPTVPYLDHRLPPVLDWAEGIHMYDLPLLSVPLRHERCAYEGDVSIPARWHDWLTTIRKREPRPRILTNTVLQILRLSTEESSMEITITLLSLLNVQELQLTDLDSVAKFLAEPIRSHDHSDHNCDSRCVLGLLSQVILHPESFQIGDGVVDSAVETMRHFVLHLRLPKETLNFGVFRPEDRRALHSFWEYIASEYVSLTRWTYQ
ncbi:hypothetical protein EXIGLDRAFT_702060 [Exidia glandulosa HHB12029]|uniref:Uncharacterized protein n=1 Tax=Exidia glandulosa HHB12029 TaxID=1314781 RepID=A0A165CQV1_EXIGL|nr:hypothetical protein EXIGLDRAFT_702060 [Exidia glandulosa HHB12029]